MQAPLFSAQRHTGQRTQRLRRPSYPSLLWLVLCGAVGFSLVVYKLYQLSPAPSVPAEYQKLLAAEPSPAFCTSAAPLVCAHGGDTTRHPPNTREAFQAALAAGADCAEVDVSATSDRHLINLHARELGELLQKKGVQVHSMTLAQLLALSWPGGQRLLTVRQALALVAPHVRQVILDVKTPLDKAGRPQGEVEMAQMVADLVLAVNCTNCLIWAKSDLVVQHVKKVLPRVLAGYVVMRHTQEALSDGMHHPLRLRDPEVLAVHHEMVDEAFTRDMHAAGKQVHVWTVSSSPVMKAVLDAGVDALVTNHPAAAVAAVRTLKEKCSRRRRR